MRQAILHFHDETVAEWGLEPILDAGLVDAELLSCEGARGVARIHLEEELDQDSVERLAIVRWLERISGDESESVYLVELDATGSEYWSTVDTDTLPPSSHVEITESGFELTYVGPQDRIGNAVAQFESTGNDVTLRELHEYRFEDGPKDALTERQVEVLQTALRIGYYDIPRDASMQEIASELDCHDSTVAEHLQRAERNLVTTVLGSST